MTGTSLRFGLGHTMTVLIGVFDVGVGLLKASRGETSFEETETELLRPTTEDSQMSWSIGVVIMKFLKLHRTQFPTWGQFTDH